MKNRFNISRDLLGDILQKDDVVNPSTEDIEQSEGALIAYAHLYAVAPPLSMRDKILGKIQKISEQQTNRHSFTLENAPLLTADANWLDWVDAVKGIMPPDDFEAVHLHTFRNDDVAEMHLAWVKEEVPEEVHHDVLESFILLEGTCECHIINEDGTHRTVRMREGDYISFKIGEVHDIQITSSEPAKAILQWLKIAA